MDLLSEVLSEFPSACAFIKYNQIENLLERKKLSQGYITWATKHSHVHHSQQDVPSNILPQSRHGIIHDFRVACKRGPDDAVYDRHADLRQKVARGNTILQIINGPSAGYYLCLSGIKKFTGQSPVDDDDRADDETQSANSKQTNLSELYFTQASNSATQVISTWKANGEACHLSAVEIDGKVLFITGTKNTHIVVGSKGDIGQYPNNRFSIAKEFAQTLFHQLSELTEEQRNGLELFLCQTGFTAVFEILNRNHQHVEDLSCLPRNELHFITWTSPNYDATSMTALSPDDGIEIARRFGLKVINYEVVPIEKVQEHCDMIKRVKNREGNVLYYMNEKKETIGLVKVKSAWYVLCRAIREKAKYAASQSVKNPNKFSLSNAIVKAQSRLDVINGFLQIDSSVITHWKSLADAFLRFVVKQLDEKAITLDDVNNRFPPLWSRFIREQNRNDDTFLEN